MIDQLQLQPGDSFERYRIVKSLGSGGTGSVYQAIQPNTEQEVALKIVPGARVTDAELRYLIAKEAKILGKLKHPNIVRVLLAEHREDGTFWMATELLRGTTLRPKLFAAGALPIAESLLIATEVGRALAYGHKAGIVHLDIKPENVFIVGKDDEDRPTYAVKVLDYGIAKLTRAGMKSTLRGRRFGTPHYSAPEQLSGERVGPASDIYSLGVMLYEMIAGRHMFATGPHFEGCPEGIALSVAQQEREPPPLAELDELPYLRAPLLKMLAKSPTKRFQSMTETVETLTEARLRYVREATTAASRTSWATTDRLPDAAYVTPEPSPASTSQGEVSYATTEPDRFSPPPPNAAPNTQNNKSTSAQENIIPDAQAHKIIFDLTVAADEGSYERALTLLGAHSRHAMAAVRAFAITELGRIGNEVAARWLRDCLPDEKHDIVRAKIEAAISAVEARVEANRGQQKSAPLPATLRTGDVTADREAGEEIHELFESDSHLNAVAENAAYGLVHRHPAVRAKAADVAADFCIAPYMLGGLRVVFEREQHPIVRERIRIAIHSIEEKLGVLAEARGKKPPSVPKIQGSNVQKSINAPVQVDSGDAIQTRVTPKSASREPRAVTGPTPAPVTTDSGVAPVSKARPRRDTWKSVALGALIGIPISLIATLGILGRVAPAPAAAPLPAPSASTSATASPSASAFPATTPPTPR